jgi:hypothetical protein
MRVCIKVVKNPDARATLLSAMTPLYPVLAELVTTFIPVRVFTKTQVLKKLKELARVELSGESEEEVNKHLWITELISPVPWLYLGQTESDYALREKGKHGGVFYPE